MISLSHLFTCSIFIWSHLCSIIVPSFPLFRSCAIYTTYQSVAPSLQYSTKIIGQGKTIIGKFLRRCYLQLNWKVRFQNNCREKYPSLHPSVLFKIYSPGLHSSKLIFWSQAPFQIQDFFGVNGHRWETTPFWSYWTRWPNDSSKTVNVFGNDFKIRTLFTSTRYLKTPLVTFQCSRQSKSLSYQPARRHFSMNWPGRSLICRLYEDILVANQLRKSLAYRLLWRQFILYDQKVSNLQGTKIFRRQCRTYKKN